MKGNQTMKIRNTHFITPIPALLIAFALSCLLANAAPAGPSIVGLWHVYYHGDLEGVESFDQWHSDGQEYEVANVFGGSCQGTYKQNGQTVQLFHTGWLYNPDGTLFGYFNEVSIITVALDGKTYAGNWDEKDYDVNGNFVSEESGTLNATRLTVNTPP
jgi:hypothetical protein